MLFTFLPVFVAEAIINFGSSFSQYLIVSICNMLKLVRELENIILEKNKLFSERYSSELLMSRNLSELRHKIIYEY